MPSWFDVALVQFSVLQNSLSIHPPYTIHMNCKATRKPCNIHFHCNSKYFFSEKLLDLISRVTVFLLQLGQYTGQQKPLPEYHVRIAGFDERVSYARLSIFV